MIQIKATEGPRETYIAFLIDRSSSMAGSEEFIVETVNDMFAACKASHEKKDSGSTTKLCIKFFDTDILETVPMTDISKLDGLLTRDEYRPQKMTCLHEVMGDTIFQLQKYDDPTKDVAFLIVVFSDGNNTVIRRHTAESVRAMIQEAKSSERWSFQYFGCDENATKKAQQDYDIPVAFAPRTQQGFRASSDSLKRGMDTYFGARSQSIGTVACLMDTSIGFDKSALEGGLLEEVVTPFARTEFTSKTGPYEKKV